jgi:hypothetical protein
MTFNFCFVLKVMLYRESIKIVMDSHDGQKEQNIFSQNVNTNCYNGYSQQIGEPVSSIRVSVQKEKEKKRG